MKKFNLPDFKTKINKKYAATAACIAIAAASVLLVRGFLHIEKPEGDISIGRVELAELEEQDVGAVQEEIRAIHEAREAEMLAAKEAEAKALEEQRLAELEAQNIAEAEARAIMFEEWSQEANAMADADQFKAIFADSVVMGDSMVNGIIQTDILFPNNVVSKVGASFGELLEMVPQVQAIYPSRIFLYCGFNDIALCRGDKEDYYQKLVDLVTSLQAACPGIPIYINQMVGPLNLDTLDNGNFNEMDYYNGLIGQVAVEYGLTVIQTDDLVKEEFYYKDGYHMIYPFYPLWMRRMAEVSGLM